MLSEVDKLGGWLTREEAKALYRAAHHAAERRLPIVQVGRHQGKLTYILGKVAQSHCQVHAFDSSNGQVRADFKRNVRQFRKTVVPIYEEPNGAWYGDIGLLVIDRLPHYADLKRDLEAFQFWLRKGSLVAFHDYHEKYGDVRQFVNEILRHEVYLPRELADSLYVVERA